MLDAFLIYLQAENTLSNDEIEKATLLVREIKKSGDAETDELNFLCELAVKWVILNPVPINITR